MVEDQEAQRRRELARKGGRAVAAKYGRRYMAALGAVGGTKSGDVRYQGVVKCSLTLRPEQWDALAEIADEHEGTSVSFWARVAIDELLKRLKRLPP